MSQPKTEWQAIFQKAFGRSIDTAANTIGAHPKTIKRWNDKNEAPTYAMKLSNIASGDLSTMFPNWKNWQLRNNTIITPDNRSLDVEFLKNLPTYCQELRAREIRLQAALKELLSS